MGLFRRTSREERAAEGLRKAEDVAAGRGLTGRLAKGFIGAENAALLNDGLASIRDAQAAHGDHLAAQEIVAAGGPSIRATVAGLADTGQLINHDPVVLLTLTLEDGRQLQLRSLVSKLQIPRVGDAVRLFEHPSQPGGSVYGGLVA